MKKTLFFLLLIFQISWGQNDFDKANEFYRKDQFAEAAKTYESILKTNNQSAELYFNLGNCYYKMNKVAPAIYNYEKALLLNPNDREIQTNLQFAQKLQIDDIREVKLVGFKKAIHDFNSMYSYDTWAGIAVGLSFAFLLSFLVYYFSPLTLVKRGFFTLMILVFIGVLTSVSAGFSVRKYVKSDHPAIIFAQIVPLKSEPKTDSPDAVLLHEGTKVKILESLDNWKKVQLPNETEGWIDQNAIKEIK